MFDFLEKLGPFGAELGLFLLAGGVVLLLNLPFEIRYRRALARRAPALRRLAESRGDSYAESWHANCTTEFPGVPGLPEDERTLLNVVSGRIAGTPFRMFDAPERPGRRRQRRSKYYRHTHLLLHFPGVSLPDFELQPVAFRSRSPAPVGVVDPEKARAALARVPRDNELDVPEHPGFDDLYWLEHGHAPTVRAAVPPALLAWLVDHPGWVVAAAGEWVRLERHGRFLGMDLPEVETIPAFLDGAAEIIGILSAALNPG